MVMKTEGGRKEKRSNERETENKKTILEMEEKGYVRMKDT